MFHFVLASMHRIPEIADRNLPGFPQIKISWDGIGLNQRLGVKSRPSVSVMCDFYLILSLIRKGFLAHEPIPVRQLPNQAFNHGQKAMLHIEPSPRDFPCDDLLVPLVALDLMLRS